MSNNQNKLFSIIVYFTLAVLAIGAAGFYIFATINNDLAAWAKIVYYVWTGLVVGAIVFDVVCTITGEGKFLSSIIIYVLSLLAALMTIIIYLTNASTTGLNADFLTTYLQTSILSLIISGYMIATWFAGKNLIRYKNQITNQ